MKSALDGRVRCEVRQELGDWWRMSEVKDSTNSINSINSIISHHINLGIYARDNTRQTAFRTRERTNTYWTCIAGADGNKAAWTARTKSGSHGTKTRGESECDEARSLSTKPFPKLAALLLNKSTHRFESSTDGSRSGKRVVRKEIAVRIGVVIAIGVVKTEFFDAIHLRFRGHDPIIMEHYARVAYFESNSNPYMEDPKPKCDAFPQRKTNPERIDGAAEAAFASSSEALYRSPDSKRLDAAYFDSRDDSSMPDWRVSSIAVCSKHNYNKRSILEKHKAAVSLASCVCAFFTLDLNVPVSSAQIIEWILKVNDVHIAEERIVVALKNVEHSERLHVRFCCKGIGTVVRGTRSADGNIQLKENGWNPPIL